MKSLRSLVLRTTLTLGLSGCGDQPMITEDLSDKVMKTMAGEDGIITNQEKSEFLREMKISTPIDENDTLYLALGGWSNNVYLIYKGPTRSKEKLGEATQKQFKDYIKKYSK